MHDSRERRTLHEHDEMVVAPDGSRVAGWIADDVRCPACAGPEVYDLDFDAHFCPACNEWREVACDDSECAHCQGRPAHPLPRSATARGCA